MHLRGEEKPGYKIYTYPLHSGCCSTLLEYPSLPEVSAHIQ